MARSRCQRERGCRPDQRSIRRYPRWTRVRFTLDSNILVRALASPRGPALRVLEIIRRAHTLVLSQSILDEVERVLMYPRLQARYRITASEAARFTGNLAGVAHMVEAGVHGAGSSGALGGYPRGVY